MFFLYRVIPNCQFRSKTARLKTFTANQIDEIKDPSGLFYILPFQKVIQLYVISSIIDLNLKIILKVFVRFCLYGIFFRSLRNYLNFKWDLIKTETWNCLVKNKWPWFNYWLWVWILLVYIKAKWDEHVTENSYRESSLYIDIPFEPLIFWLLLTCNFLNF